MEVESQFIQIGSIQIRYYGIIIVAALLAATFVALNIAKRSGRDTEHVYGALTWAIIPGIILARMWFVTFPPVSNVNTTIQEELNFTVPASAIVSEEGEIVPDLNNGLEFIEFGEDSPLAEAGVQVDDRIRRFKLPDAEQFTAVMGRETLTQQLADLDSNAEIELQVERGVSQDRAWYYRNFFDLDNGAIAIWSGGLSIFGALLGGIIGAYIYLRKNGLPIPAWLDIAAIVVPLGQAIGRWANYINEELFGTLVDPSFPLALSIPIEKGRAALEAAERLPGTLLDYTADGANLTFHPLFLYESVWSLAAFIVLLWLYNRHRDRFRPGDFFLMYIMQYAVIRFLLEFIRLEVSMLELPGVGEVNVAQLVTAVAFVLALALFLYRLTTRDQDSRSYDEIAPPVWPTAASGSARRKPAAAGATAAGTESSDDSAADDS